MRPRCHPAVAAVLLAPVAFALLPRAADSACCYFSAKDKDVLQPAQKAFLTYDPAGKVEAFTVQPKFEGNAVDFGMVIPTPSRPKLDTMPRDFFKHLAVFTILKKREQPKSKLLPDERRLFSMRAGAAVPQGVVDMKDGAKPAVKVLEAGIVGSLEYKIVEAGRADDLYQWLKDNRYSYSGDEATLDFYVQKKWLFTVMKIDTAQMKKNPDGSYAGEVTPTRFRFASDKFVYPLRITRISVKDRTEALFYVQAPYKTDLEGDWTYQYQWVPMLQNARGWYDKGIFGGHDLPGRGDDWLQAVQPKIPELMQRAQQLGFGFVSGQRPRPNKDGNVATTLEWARKLDKDDVGLLKGEVAFGEKVPNVDEGFTQADLQDEKKREQTYKTIRERLEKYRKERPGGYLVRSAPAADVNALKQLLGHLQEGQFVTKFRKEFTKGEMTDDLVIVPAKVGDAEDRSEYTEILPTSPP
ncbi:MAG TPA: DUF2330 domain-containing protein [Gemmataceae bacterium]|jgi:hypothetical protein